MPGTCTLYHLGSPKNTQHKISSSISFLDNQRPKHQRTVHCIPFINSNQLTNKRTQTRTLSIALPIQTTVAKWAPGAHTRPDSSEGSIASVPAVGRRSRDDVENASVSASTWPGGVLDGGISMTVGPKQIRVKRKGSGATGQTMGIKVRKWRLSG